MQKCEIKKIKKKDSSKTIHYLNLCMHNKGQQSDLHSVIQIVKRIDVLQIISYKSNTIMKG